MSTLYAIRWTRPDGTVRTTSPQPRPLDGPLALARALMPASWCPRQVRTTDGVRWEEASRG